MSEICFKIIHAGGGVGTRRDEGKLAMLLITAEAAKDGSRGSVYYSYCCCVGNCS